LFIDSCALSTNTDACALSNTDARAQPADTSDYGLPLRV
jgi:hypothetical protein